MSEPTEGEPTPAKQAEGYAIFNIKNPSKADDKFTLRVRLDATVDELRALITQTYDGRPPPSQQTLVYAGRVLNQGNCRVKDFLQKQPDDVDPSTPHSLHLVIRSSTQPTESQPPRPAASTLLNAPSPGIDQRAASSASTSTGPSSSTSTTAPSAPSASSPPYAAAPSTTPPVSTSMPATSSAPSGTFFPPQGFATQPTTAGQAPSGQSPYFLVMNPVMAAAYQAAYTAALAAAASGLQNAADADSRQGPSGSQLPAGVGMPFAFVCPNPQAQPGTSGAAQSPFGPYVTYPAVPVPYGMYPMGMPGPYTPMPQMQPPAQQDDGLAQRMMPGGRGHTIFVQAQRMRGNRVNRMRVFRFRLNLRVLLQLLVFVFVFYQHFTLSRFLILLTGATVIWATSSWAPLRRFITSLLHPPAPLARPPAGPIPQPPAANLYRPADPAAAQQAPPQDPSTSASASTSAAAPSTPADPNAAASDPQQQQQPPPPAQQLPLQNGILREIAVLLIGFVTSLVPGWQFNPEDAAAVAAAQQALAAQQAAQGQEEGEEEDEDDGDHPHRD